MFRFIVEFLLPAGVLFAAFYYGVKYHLLKRRWANLEHSMEHPELLLPRRERQEWARKMCQRKDDQYNQESIDRLNAIMKGDK